MCGRTANPFSLQELKQQFRRFGHVSCRFGYRARSAYNVSPGQFQYVMYGEKLDAASGSGAASIRSCKSVLREPVDDNKAEGEAENNDGDNAGDVAEGSAVIKTQSKSRGKSGNKAGATNTRGTVKSAGNGAGSMAERKESPELVENGKTNCRDTLSSVSPRITRSCVKAGSRKYSSNGSGGINCKAGSSDSGGVNADDNCDHKCDDSEKVDDNDNNNENGDDNEKDDDNKKGDDNEKGDENKSDDRSAYKKYDKTGAVDGEDSRESGKERKVDIYHTKNDINIRTSGEDNGRDSMTGSIGGKANAKAEAKIGFEDGAKNVLEAKADAGGEIRGEDEVASIASSVVKSEISTLSHELVDQSEKYELVLREMKWGLIPSWTKKQPSFQKLRSTINCREESLNGSSGLWNSVKHKKRCIVPALGYYEWRLGVGGTKEPFFLKNNDGRPLLFAGLYDHARLDGAADATWSYTIITTNSSPDIAWLHNRMPVIFDNDDMHAIFDWLNPNIPWNMALQKEIRPHKRHLEW